MVVLKLLLSIAFLRLFLMILFSLLLLSILIRSRLHHAAQQLDAFARLVTVILHLALLRLRINATIQYHLATAVTTGAASTSALTTLHNLAFREIRLRNLSIMERDDANATDAHRFEIVLVILSALQTTQLLVSLLRVNERKHKHLLPHGDQILVCQLIPNAVVIHLAVDHSSFVGFPNVSSTHITEYPILRSLVMNLKNGPNRLLLPLSVMRSTLGYL